MKMTSKQDRGNDFEKIQTQFFFPNATFSLSVNYIGIIRFQFSYSQFEKFAESHGFPFSYINEKNFQNLNFKI